LTSQNAGKIQAASIFMVLSFAGTGTAGARAGCGGEVPECPSCALYGNDRDGDNLAIAVDEPYKYKCWAGCTKKMIREALGIPIRTC